MLPRPGDVLYVSRTASVQFDGDRALVFKVIRVDAHTTYEGWIWLAGYVLGPGRQAMDRRLIFVQLAGLRLMERAGSPGSATRTRGRPGTSATGGPGLREAS